MGLYLELPQATFIIQFAGTFQGFNATIDDKRRKDRYEIVKGCDDAAEAKRFCEFVARSMD